MVARTYTALPPIIDIWFQFLFHSPLGVLFTFPSRYLFTIGHQEVFSLARWSGQLPTELHVLRGTREMYYCFFFFLPTRLSLSLAALSRAIQLRRKSATQKLYLLNIHPHNPYITTHTGYHIIQVWAVPLSLTTTEGITSFSFPSVT